jgi:energy-converting hydrogenase Eha subunit H
VGLENWAECSFPSSILGNLFSKYPLGDISHIVSHISLLHFLFLLDSINLDLELPNVEARIKVLTLHLKVIDYM